MVLSAAGLRKTYRMGEVDVHALRGVDFGLRKGELVVLLGASGSGKSTLLNLIGGLDIPTAGTLRYLDHDLTRADDRALTRYRREHVGFVFQFYNLIPSLTARENVSLVTEIARRPLPSDEALALVGLAARLDHFPAQHAVITHNAPIARMADRVVQLADGRIVADRRNDTKAAPAEIDW
jgi:putative ABC transport system ATP-binding protein